MKQKKQESHIFENPQSHDLKELRTTPGCYHKNFLGVLFLFLALVEKGHHIGPLYVLCIPTPCRGLSFIPHCPVFCTSAVLYLIPWIWEI